MTVCELCGAPLHTIENMNIVRRGDLLAERWMPPGGCVCGSPSECAAGECQGCEWCVPSMNVCRSCGDAPQTLFEAVQEVNCGDTSEVREAATRTEA